MTPDERAARARRNLEVMLAELEAELAGAVGVDEVQAVRVTGAARAIDGIIPDRRAWTPADAPETAPESPPRFRGSTEEDEFHLLMVR
jgi:hypothetical protein